MIDGPQNMEQSAFPYARFAHHGKSFPFAENQVKPTKDVDFSITLDKGFAQILDLNEFSHDIQGTPAGIWIAGSEIDLVNRTESPQPDPTWLPAVPDRDLPGDRSEERRERSLQNNLEKYLPGPSKPGKHLSAAR
jgi:hypothetical protein